MTGEVVWQAAVLGVVQGLTEFLPVSSTAHLILVPTIFGWRAALLNELSFDVALHLGTIVALLAVFWREWVRLCFAAWRSIRNPRAATGEARLAWLIVLATVPGAVAGGLFERQIETALRSPVVIGVTMIGVALVLAVVDRLGARAHDEYGLGAAPALAIGIGQACALIPGVSRSGATIAVGMGVGMSRAAAARFSFLLSTPIILGAIGKQFFDLARHGVPASDLLPLAVGILAAAVTGYLCIRGLLSYLRRRSLMPFVVYRVVIGAVVLVLALSGRISAP
ncbi:MAG TPA: undecaprenyl-diphosphate phosphatase [Chloroflexota bacterium]|nr:undecaprenyl-diphosphate phosphatase [Chloroflexota bacterium]